MFVKFLFCRSGLVITPPAVKNLATPTHPDMHFHIYVKRNDIPGKNRYLSFLVMAVRNAVTNCYVCGLNVRSMKQRDVWSSRYCTWSLRVRCLIMIRDCKICVLVSNSFSMPLQVPYGLRGLTSPLWPKCNRLLRLGRPWGAVTLSRWGGWWYTKYQEGP
jgi:hypothetical protein